MKHPSQSSHWNGLLALAPLFFVLPAACSSENPAPGRSSDATLVEAVRPVAMTQAGSARSFDAVVRARRSINLGFKQGGRLAAVKVEVGQIVQAGQALAFLTQPEAQAAVDQAAGEQAVALAALRQAEDAAARVNGLDQDGTVAAGDVRQRRFAAEGAKARLLAAQAQLRQMRATVSDGVLRAPADGVITQIVAEPGTVVGAGAPVIQIATGPSEVELKVPEDVVLHAGATASVTFWNRPEQVQARLRAISPEGDGLRMRKAWFTLPAAAAAVPLGNSATVVIDASDRDQQMRIPLTAVSGSTTIGETARVWTLTQDGRHARPSPIRILALRGEDAVISGLFGNASVIASGTEGLRPGQAVTVVEMLGGGR